MKKNKKIIISLCVSSLLSGILINPILANDNIVYDTANITKILDDEFNKNNTDVVSELQKLKEKYVNLLDNVISNYDRESINTTISNLDLLINEYKITSKLKASHSTNVSAVVAWFGMQGYLLSADLLVHMKMNKKLNSYYTPASHLLQKVTNSSRFLRIRDAKKTSGSDAFPNSGSVGERDCYYAIHKFNFSKPSANSRQVTITDTYDYDSTKNYEGIAGIAINAMYKAQQDGYLTPFKIKWTFK
ncbi:hypothetical protein [Thomasclavelia spiroformis]|uniref:hypothetical protein n=1 Tax=Thomasclavelia spiroformis TaxID=29348 RepID=UPI0025953BE4|nr:hypothetical protein [uncultured Thomasclavelia sp.]